MYRITIVTGGEPDLDLIEPSFPYTFESGSIAELTNKSASWSYSIRLPRTAKNEKIFKNAGSPFVDTDTPYSRFICNVYANGIRIINNGVLFLDKATDDEYSVQIVSGFADVFELMKDNALGTDITNSTARPGTAFPSEAGLAVPLSYPQIAKLSADGQILMNSHCKTNPSGMGGGLYWYAAPIVRIGSYSHQNCLLKKIMQKIGFSFVTDVPDSELNSLFLSLVTLKKTGTSQICWTSTQKDIPEARSGGTFINTEGYADPANLRVYVQFKPHAFTTSGGGYISTRNIWEAWFDTGQVTSGTEPTIYVNFSNQLNQAIGSLSIKKSDWVNAGRPDTYEGVLELGNSATNAHAYVYAVFNHNANNWSYTSGGTTTNFNTFYFDTRKYKTQTYVDDDSEFCYPGQSLELYQNLGIKTALDAFKIIAQLYGWTIAVDQSSHTMYAYTFAYVIGRKQYAPDWTAKIDMSSGTETDFNFGNYARQNIVKFDSNKLTGYQDTAAFTIPNDTLSPSKDAIAMKISSGQGEYIEQWEAKEEGSNEYQWKDGSVPHLLRWDGSTLSHVTTADVINNYADIIDTMQKVRVVTAKFNLTPVDILNFDQFTPIFLKQYGRYFYVNKISNWEAGKLCDVELLQLSS